MFELKFLTAEFSYWSENSISPLEETTWHLATALASKGDIYLHQNSWEGRFFLGVIRI